MTVEVSVLYSDLSIRSAPITDMEPLPKHGVQGVALRTEAGKPLGHMTGRDYYAVCWMTDSLGDRTAILGHDDGDFTWRPVHDWLQSLDALIPLGCLHVWFKGEQVTNEQFALVDAKLQEMLRS